MGTALICTRCGGACPDPSWVGTAPYHWSCLERVKDPDPNHNDDAARHLRLAAVRSRGDGHIIRKQILEEDTQ